MRTAHAHATHATSDGAHGDDHHAVARHRFAGITSIVGPGVLVAVVRCSRSRSSSRCAARGEMHAPFVQRYFSWMPVGDLQIDAAFQLDQLSMVMMLVITGVGTLIHIFSVGYMRDDPGYPRYFAYLNLFVFFMLVLVLGANYPVLFVGWEGVGLCSYLLIGFWFSDKANADAGKKAFIVNRIGDFGFLIAMFMLFANIGTLDFAGVSAAAPQLGVRRRARHDDLPLPVPRLRRQERADPALRLAAGRDGRPDAGVGADPRGDDGDGRRVSRRAQQRSCSRSRRSRSSTVVAHRRADGALRGDDRPQAVGHQEGPRVFDRLAARLHVRRRGRRARTSAGMFHLVTHAFFKALLFLGSGSVIYAMHARVSSHAAATRTRRTCATWAG